MAYRTRAGGIEAEQPGAGLGRTNSAAAFDLLVALRGARERTGLTQTQAAHRMALGSPSSTTPIERLRTDARLPTLRRYTTAVAMRLELSIIGDTAPEPPVSPPVRGPGADHLRVTPEPSTDSDLDHPWPVPADGR